MWRRETKSWQNPYTPETRARCYNLDPGDMCIVSGGAAQTFNNLPRAMRACFSYLVPEQSMTRLVLIEMSVPEMVACENNFSIRSLTLYGTWLI